MPGPNRTTPNQKTALGRRVRARRKQLGLTGAHVEKLTAIGSATLSLIETGKQDPSLAQLRSLAKALKTTLGDLLGIRRPSSGSQPTP